MKRILVILAFGLYPFLLHSQAIDCGTKLLPGQNKLLRSFHPDLTASASRIAAEPVRLALAIHVVNRDNGAGGINASELSHAISDLNDIYAEIGFNFFIIRQTEINSTQHFDLDTKDEIELCSERDIPNVINIYLFNSITNQNDEDLCGQTYFPGGPERIILTNDCVVNGNSLPHEMGHFFTLMHTHGAGYGASEELVDGSNCEVEGDEICDTPADPGLSRINVSESCTYTGLARDANGQLYTPDTRNLMSYSRTECRDSFTEQQRARIMAAYEEFRTNIYNKEVVATYSQSTDRICIGNSVQFQNMSLGAETYQWEFAGGIPANSTEQNPMVSYDELGSYSVKLVVTGPDGQDSAIHSGAVIVEPPLIPNFTSRSETFEGELSAEIINPNNDLTFEPSDIAIEGARSYLMRFYDYSHIGREDYIKLGGLNTDLNKVVKVTFEYAYAYYDETLFDRLELVYRVGCDDEWIVVWSDSGSTLATAGSKEDAFIPVEADWDVKQLEFTVGKDISTIEVALRTINGFGNNLYIDHFRAETGSNSDFGNVKIDVDGIACFGDNNATIDISTDGTDSYEFGLDSINFFTSGYFQDLPAGDHLAYVRKNGSELLAKSYHISQPDSMYFDLDISVANCDTSAVYDVIVHGHGGSRPYRYLIDDGAYTSDSVFLGVGSGPQSIWMQDSLGCEVSQVVNFPTYNPLDWDIDIMDVQCFGEPSGEIRIEASGGFGDLTFALNGVELSDSSHYPGIVQGDYLLTVQDEVGCELTQTVTVGAPSQIKLSSTIDQPACFGELGSIAAIAEGGAGEIKYSLDSGKTWQQEGDFLGLSSGSYLLLAADTLDCSRSYEFDINEPSQLKVGVSYQDEVCYNSYLGTITMIPEGGTPPYQMLVNGGAVSGLTIDSLTSGNYFLEIVDQMGCRFYDTISIVSDRQLPPIPIIFVEGYELSVKADTFQVQWYRNGERINQAINNTYELTQAGTFQVTYAYQGGFCEVFSDELQLQDVHLPKAEFEVFPNPVSGKICLKMPAILALEIDQLRIIDLAGKEVYRSGYREELDINIPPGIYFVELSGRDIVMFRKFVKL